MRADVPPLTVTLIGNRWKSHVNIHVLMQDRTLEDVRKFVRLYLQKMQYSEANLEALRSIADWFSPALEAAKEQWVQATKDFNNGFQTQHVYPFKPTRAQATKNKKLLKAVEDAKKAVERLEKHRKVFFEECTARNIPIPTKTPCE